METKLSRKQRDIVNQFQEFTGCRNKKLAVNILVEGKWDISQSCDLFFTNYAHLDEAMEEKSSSKSKKSSKSKGTYKNIQARIFIIDYFQI